MPKYFVSEVTSSSLRRPAERGVKCEILSSFLTWFSPSFYRLNQNISSSPTYQNKWLVPVVNDNNTDCNCTFGLSTSTIVHLNHFHIPLRNTVTQDHKTRYKCHLFSRSSLISIIDNQSQYHRNVIAISVSVHTPGVTYLECNFMHQCNVNQTQFH